MIPKSLPALAMAVFALGAAPMAGFKLTSAAFADNHAIPSVHSCDGDNSSPALAWSGAPGGTRSLALVVRDPDAPSGEFIHWVLYDLPPTLTRLPSGQYTAAHFPLGGLEGRNSFGNLGYGGPCPPPGSPHHYIFTLFALSQSSLALPPGASREDVASAMQGKILAQTTLTGIYARKASR